MQQTIACAKKSFTYQASESLAYSKLSQQGSTESWGKAGNRQPKRRQGWCRPQPLVVNWLSPEICFVVWTPTSCDRWKAATK